jgi:hypothetical protein
MTGAEPAPETLCLYNLCRWTKSKNVDLQRYIIKTSECTISIISETPCRRGSVDIYLGSVVRLFQSMCHLIWCPGHSVRGPRPVNMDFNGGFGGGGRLYIVSSLISPLIVTVTVLLDYNGSHQCSDLRMFYWTHSYYLFYICTHFLLPFTNLHGLCELSGNSEVMNLMEHVLLVMACNFDATCFWQPRTGLQSSCSWRH